MLAWWAARFARMLYDFSQGQDRRHAERQDGWGANIQAKYIATWRWRWRLTSVFRTSGRLC
jgi:hypothetical protein